MKITILGGRSLLIAMLLTGGVLTGAVLAGGCGNHPSSGAASTYAPSGVPSPSLVAHDAAKEKREGK